MVRQLGSGSTAMLSQVLSFVEAMLKLLVILCYIEVSAEELEEQERGEVQAAAAAILPSPGSILPHHLQPSPPHLPHQSLHEVNSGVYIDLRNNELFPTKKIRSVSQ
jgi:hypothetical protein